MKTACKYGLVSNPQKTHIRAQAVKFCRCMYDADGMHPHPKKVEVVQSLPAPKSLTELQDFLGVGNLPRPVHPELSMLTDPIHDLMNMIEYSHRSHL